MPLRVHVLQETSRKTAREGRFVQLLLAGPTGFEPAISSVTGRRDRPASLRAHVPLATNL